MGLRRLGEDGGVCFLLPPLNQGVGKLLCCLPVYQFGLDPLRVVAVLPLLTPLPVRFLISGVGMPLVWMVLGLLLYVVSFVWI